MFEEIADTPLQLISDKTITTFGVKLYIKREDLIHPNISGNKWRKLKYNLLDAKEKGFKKIVTCGGAYSNHIAALSAACQQFQFESIGIIRGEEYSEVNPTLSLAQSKGMKLIYFPRDRYRQGITEATIKELLGEREQFYFIPEGGTNELAVKGTREIIDDIKIDFNYICSPVGTGGTLAGLIASKSKMRFKVLGFSALKNTGFLEENVVSLIGEEERQWKIMNEYNFGGYAKFNDELIKFINDFYVENQIELDPVYTGKMMFGIYDLIKVGFFLEGATIVAVHTGGIQGKKGFNQRFGNVLL